MKPLLLLAGISLSSAVLAAPTAPSAHHTPQCAPSVAALSRQVAVLLKNNDARALSRLVDVKRGLQISFEPHASKEDVRLNRSQVAALRTDRKVRNWGTSEGEGAEIRLNWANYRKQSVCPRDFTSGAQLSINQPSKAHSTLENNLREFYPNSTRVELYLPPTSPDKLDWATLWMVWHKSGGAWRLIGIANEQWSP